MSLVPYDVSYSGRVRESLHGLLVRAQSYGLASQLINAINDLDYRLRIYPQFGQPLRDLSVDSAQLCIGVVPPLVVHYILDEGRRRVMVVRPMQSLKRSGL